MSKPYLAGNTNYNRNENQRSGSKQGPEDIAARYVPDIRLLLEYENTSTINIKKAVEKIEDLVKNNSKISTHQIRNIYKLIQDVNDIKKLNLIRPKLAYIAARQKDDHGKVIATVIDSLIVLITNEKDGEKQHKELNGLKYVMESIVAYHKFHVKEK